MADELKRITKWTLYQAGSPRMCDRTKCLRTIQPGETYFAAIGHPNSREYTATVLITLCEECHDLVTQHNPESAGATRQPAPEVPLQ